MSPLTCLPRQSRDIDGEVHKMIEITRECAQDKLPPRIGLGYLPVFRKRHEQGDVVLRKVVLKRRILPLFTVDYHPHRFIHCEGDGYGNLQIVKPKGGRFGDEDYHIRIRDGLYHGAGCAWRGVDDLDIPILIVFLDCPYNRSGHGLAHSEDPLYKIYVLDCCALFRIADFALLLPDGPFGTDFHAEPAAVAHLRKDHVGAWEVHDGLELALRPACSTKRAFVEVDSRHHHLH